MAEPAPVKFASSAAIDVAIPMADGHELLADIHYPRGATRLAPLAVLLERGPDRKDSAVRRRRAERLAGKGFVVVCSENRGSRSARGVPADDGQEESDGAATVDWIANQEWFAGRFGVYGSGYQGFAALCVTPTQPLERFAKSVHEPVDRHNLLSLRNGGAQELWHLSWHLKAALPDHRDLFKRPSRSGVTRAARIDVGDWLLRLPFRLGANPLTPLPALEDWYFSELARGPWDADDEIERWAETESAAVQLLGGWYSTEAASTLRRYQALERTGRRPCELLIGPWTSTRGPDGPSGEVDFGPHSQKSLELESLRWLQEQLAPEAHETVAARERVRVFIAAPAEDGAAAAAGDGCWLAEERWPETDTYELHLVAGGGLEPRAGSSEAHSSLIFDPSQPVPTIGGNLRALGFIPAQAPDLPGPLTSFLRDSDLLPYAGGLDQRERRGWYGCREPYLPLATRADVLTFTTAPLAEDLIVLGHIRTILFIRSTIRHGDIAAKLVDLYPPSLQHPHGFALNVCDGICRFSPSTHPGAVGSGDDDQLEVIVELGCTGRRFRAGHRIRLDLAGSNFPRFDLNPTLAARDDSTPPSTRPTAVLHSTPAPSRIVLPIVRKEQT